MFLFIYGCHHVFSRGIDNKVRYREQDSKYNKVRYREQESKYIRISYHSSIAYLFKLIALYC